MGNARSDQKKKPAMSAKEKRKAKNEKKQPTPALGAVGGKK